MKRLFKMVKSSAVRIRGGLAVAVLVLAPAAAWPQADTVEAGLHYNLVWPQADLAELEPGASYGFLLRYWANDTTTVDLAFDQFDSTWPVDAPGESGEIDFNQWLLTAGFRYAPEWDLVLRPSAGLGLGFQQWNTTSSVEGVKDRGGSGVSLYGVVGADYRLGRRISVGPWVRAVYVPVDEKMETEVTRTPGRLLVEKTSLEQGGLLTGGITLTVRVR